MNPKQVAISRTAARLLLPVAAAAVVAFLALVLWYLLIETGRRAMDEIVATEAAEVGRHIAHQIDERVRALRRKADRWQVEGKPSYRAWVADTANLLVDQPGFADITWVAPGGRVTWISPTAGNRAILGRNLLEDPIRRPAMEAARALRREVRTPAVDLMLGGKGFVVFVPLFREGLIFDGYITGVFEVRKLIDAVLTNRLRDDYSLAILEGEQEVFATSPGARHAPWVREAAIELYGVKWRAFVAPSESHLVRDRSLVPTIVLGGGLLLSALAGMLVFLARSAHDRAAEAEALSASLKEANALLLQQDRHKDEFLAVVSHELRTPLNFITGFTSVLQEEMAGPVTVLQREYLGRIEEGAARMFDLVTELLDLAQIRSGRLKLVVRPTELDPIFQEACRQAKIAADRLGLEVTCPGTTGLVGLVDEGRVLRILSNLLSNALKFTGRGGHVHLLARELEGGEILVQVEDTGVGIAPEEVPRLFERFSQLDMSSTRQAAGIGLGLAISRALVEAHGGRIGVDSVRGEGSTFWFTLPGSGFPPCEHRARQEPTPDQPA